MTVLIREGPNSLEIAAVDHIPPHLPSAGDVKLSIAVSSSGFTGRAFAWVAADHLAVFLTQLRDLKEHRSGSAELVGLSLNTSASGP
jgi:hypothetical protein